MVKGLDGLFHDPYLPEVGDLYWVDTSILQSKDEKLRRPAVVIRVPPSLSGRVVVVTRTTNLAVPGIPHPAEADLGLNKDGIFAYPRSAEAALWHRPNVEWMGKIDEGLFSQVIEEFLT